MGAPQQLTDRLITVYRQLPTYSVIGLTGASLDVLVFGALYGSLGWNPYLANAVSTTLGITNNYVLNSLITFRGRGDHLRRYARFATVGLLGIVLTAAIFKLGFVAGFDHARTLKVASLVPVTLFQYTLNRQWSFR